MGPLVTFLNRHMKGLRGLVMLAMIITVLQVSCDIIASFPLKFIPSKVQMGSASAWPSPNRSGPMTPCVSPLSLMSPSAPCAPNSACRGSRI